MNLKFSKSKDFASIWRRDFLGQKGFFLPGQRNLPLSKEMEVELMVAGESWGTAQVVVSWSNQHGNASDLTPHGVFLQLLKADRELERRIKDL
jgi:hypothetical protein